MIFYEKISFPWKAVRRRHWRRLEGARGSRQRLDQTLLRHLLRRLVELGLLRLGLPFQLLRGGQVNDLCDFESLYICVFVSSYQSLFMFLCYLSLELLLL